MAEAYVGVSDVVPQPAGAGKGGAKPSVDDAFGPPPDAGKAAGLPDGLWDHVKQVESGNNNRAVSAKGARGASQVMPATAGSPGYGLPPLDIKNPDAGAPYLKKMIDLSGGDVVKGLARYNAGPNGNLDNPETKGYVDKVMKQWKPPAEAIFGDDPPPSLSPLSKGPQTSPTANKPSPQQQAAQQQAQQAQQEREHPLIAAMNKPADRTVELMKQDTQKTFDDIKTLVSKPSLKGAFNTALDVVGLPFSPITSLTQAFLGDPVKETAHKLGMPAQWDPTLDTVTQMASMVGVTKSKTLQEALDPVAKFLLGAQDQHAATMVAGQSAKEVSRQLSIAEGKNDAVMTKWMSSVQSQLPSNYAAFKEDIFHAYDTGDVSKLSPEAAAFKKNVLDPVARKTEVLRDKLKTYGVDVGPTQANYITRRPMDKPTRGMFGDFDAPMDVRTKPKTLGTSAPELKERTIMGVEAPGEAYVPHEPNFEPDSAWLAKQVSVPSRKTHITMMSDPGGKDIGNDLKLVQPAGYKAGQEVWAKKGDRWERVGRLQVDTDGSVRTLAVSPEYRKKGVAQTMLQAEHATGRSNVMAKPADLSKEGAEAINKFASKQKATEGRMVGVTDPQTGRIIMYKNNQRIGSGTLTEDGKGINVQGAVWKKTEATVKEIEQHTDTRYHKDPVAAVVQANVDMQKAVINAQAIENIKASPEFRAMARPPKATAPAGWRTVDMPGTRQFEGWKMHPQMAETFEDFKNTVHGELVDRLGKMNRLVVGSLFYNPIPHVMNVLLHSVVEKGLVGNVVQLGKEAARAVNPNLSTTTVEAWKAVWNKDHNYMKYLNEGAGLMYPSVYTNDFFDQVLKKVGSDPQASNLAKAFGYANPIEWTKAVYGTARKSLWFTNDVIMMQAYLEKERAGFSPAHAVADVEKHVPNYKVPNRVLGSRALSLALRNPAISAFGRYDYGRMASYGYMLTDLTRTDKGLNAIQRAKALDQIAATAFISFFVYPHVMDKMAATVTGNPNATATRYGPATIPALVYDAFHGKRDVGSIAGSVAPASPALKIGTELYSNREGFTGQPIYDTKKDFENYIMKQFAPGQMVLNWSQGKKSAKQILGEQFGIKSPTQAQVDKTNKWLERSKKAAERKAKKQESQ